MAQQQGIQVPQFKPLPPLPHFGSPLGAPVHFLSLESFSSFIFIIFLFFNRCRLFIHPAPVTHSRTSSMARPEVVVPTLTSQTMVWLDFFFYVFTMYA
jgi:hypothetical protein